MLWRRSPDLAPGANRAEVFPPAHGAAVAERQKRLATEASPRGGSFKPLPTKGLPKPSRQIESVLGPAVGRAAERPSCRRSFRSLRHKARIRADRDDMTLSEECVCQNLMH